LILRTHRPAQALTPLPLPRPAAEAIRRDGRATSERFIRRLDFAAHAVRALIVDTEAALKIEPAPDRNNLRLRRGVLRPRAIQIIDPFDVPTHATRENDEHRRERSRTDDIEERNSPNRKCVQIHMEDLDQDRPESNNQPAFRRPDAADPNDVNAIHYQFSSGHR